MPPKSKFKFALAGNYFTKWPNSTKEIQECVGKKLLSIESQLVKGVNSVTQLLEKEELAFVVICNVKRFSVMIQHLPFMCSLYSTLCIAFTEYSTPLQYEAVGFKKSKLAEIPIANEIMEIIRGYVTPSKCPLILSNDVKYTSVELVAKIRGDYTPN